MSKATTHRITMITLTVDDVAKAARYYQQVGFRPAQDAGTDDIKFFQLNGQMLAVYSAQKHHDDLGIRIDGQHTGAIALSTNFATTQEVDEAYQGALDAGASSKQEPKAAFWGGYNAVVIDPFGHLWEYAMNPFWALDENGYLTNP